MRIKRSLAETHPKVAEEWHPLKNGNLTPNDVTHGMNKKFWWKCDKGDDHVWLATVNNRANGRKCPVCSGKKVVNSNCLSTLRPDLAKQWHPTKNGNLKPQDVTQNSNKKRTQVYALFLTIIYVSK